MPIQFNKTVAILISGRAGVGKTTLANYIRHEYIMKYDSIVDIFPFAQGVKKTAKYMGWGGKKDEKGRWLLQEIGKLGRAYDKDCWARRTYDIIIPNHIFYPFDVVISDDYRFPNEGDYVKSLGDYQVFEIRVFAPDREILKGTDAYNDISETSLPELYEPGLERYFTCIYNNGTLEELQEKAKWSVESINFAAEKWG